MRMTYQTPMQEFTSELGQMVYQYGISPVFSFLDNVTGARKILEEKISDTIQDDLHRLSIPKPSVKMHVQKVKANPDEPEVEQLVIRHVTYGLESEPYARETFSEAAKALTKEKLSDFHNRALHGYEIEGDRELANLQSECRKKAYTSFLKKLILV